MKSAPAVLQELKRRGYKLAILSNAATPQYTRPGGTTLPLNFEKVSLKPLNALECKPWQKLSVRRHVLQHEGLREILDPALCHLLSV